MTSLAEVYEGLGEEASRRQLYAGTGLFVVGASLLVAGIVVATTGVLSPFGLNEWQSWEPAGVLAGLGLPAVFLGIFTVLPAGREVRAAAVIGASVAVLGVTLFAHAYPTRWIGNSPNLTPLVTLVYFLGAITTFWCLFTAVATFQSRNDPGGTVRLEVTRGGETRVVEVDRNALPRPLDAVGWDEPGGSGALETELVGETAPTGGHSASTGARAGGVDGSPGSEVVDGTESTTAWASDEDTERSTTWASDDDTERSTTWASEGDPERSTAWATDSPERSAGSETPSSSERRTDSEILGESERAAESATDGDPDRSAGSTSSGWPAPSNGSTEIPGAGDWAELIGASGTDEPDRSGGADDDSVAERTAGAVRPATDAPGEAGDGATPQPASDGGATSPGVRTPADDAEVLDSRSDPADTTDSYCGNCKHFRYVQTSRGIRPFCELDDGIMDDVEACDRWEPNRLD